MKTQPHTANDLAKSITNLNSLLRGEISAVETYDHAITHIKDESVDDLIANRDCHSKRVDLLSKKIRNQGGDPVESSGMWGALAKLVEGSAALINTKTVIAALEEGEDRGLAQYRKPGNLDPASLQLIQSILLPRQQETHERMRALKRSQV
jgi:uncharacterized protein (TIGR02284 family)